MARPIKETPILTGKDARRFEDAIKANESKKICQQEREKIMHSYRRFQVIEPSRVD